MSKEIQRRLEVAVVNNNGEPGTSAALRPGTRVRRMRERFDAISSRVAEAYADVPADEGMEEINAAVARERQR